MGAFDEAPVVQPADRATWRDWLEANHATARGVWLVSWRPSSARNDLDYEAAVEEALCFGWVDSRGGKVDEQRTKLYFAPRNPRSGWARPNKERVERLAAAGRMAPAGISAVERAKANGSWTILDAVERLELPDDLEAALETHPPARAHWEAFSRSARRALLAWIALARRPDTRAKRVEATAAAAQHNERANERPDTKPGD
ncbi:MAG: YdeI/OmpD-associated family protein [Chloroflexota bacterium]|nr:YdeI/OmpD-associated family protein [Chloroflexota bacterium]